ncbi:MAG: helix-turn-helix transcriptional regulator, partial [Ruminococcus sp.]|nr:helix-turn-helix transcriptional regulator [Ruminococcus sp.]
NDKKGGDDMNTFNKSIFAKRLHYYMEQKGVDRRQLCDDLNLKYSTVSEWLSANKYPRIDKIELLADYFGITKSDLIEEKPAPTEDENELIKVVKELNSEFNFTNDQISRIASYMKFVGSEDSGKQ